MCSIIVVNNHKEYPLFIAANRDENIKRKSEPVQILSENPFILGGKDSVKGGTWLATNRKSLFAAITNQGAKDSKLLSRGSIVLDALKSNSLEELIDFVQKIDTAKYNKFNLVFGNQRSVFLAHSYILDSVVIRELPKGVHTITNDMRFSGNTTKIQFVHSKLDKLTAKPWLEYYKVLKKVLSSTNYGLNVKLRTVSRDEESEDRSRRTLNPMEKVPGYCTRSSTILAFSEDGLIRYKFYDRGTVKAKRKEGDPFIPKYKDYIDLWRGSVEASVNEETDEEKEVDELSDVDKLKQILMEKFKVIGRI